MQDSAPVEVAICVRSLRLKVKSEAYPWLNAAAIEVNQVWNWANETSYKAARPFAGAGKWLTEFELNNLSSGASKYFERIGSDTIQRVNAQFATRRKQFKKAKLRWRVSSGSKRNLGWVPFKAGQLKRKGRSLQFSGRGHKARAKRLHRTAARRRRDALHKFSRRITDKYQNITVGDVSALRLTKTRMAKSVLDAGWGILKTQLHYKGQQAGRHVQVVNERYTTRACSSCGSLMGPAGLDMLEVRIWRCVECGDTHDRDVNAALNILSAGRCSPSASGNESSPLIAPLSQTASRCEARTGALKAGA
jgi:IS605 OrfB family transposase